MGASYGVISNVCVCTDKTGRDRLSLNDEECSTRYWLWSWCQVVLGAMGSMLWYDGCLGGKGDICCPGGGDCRIYNGPIIGDLSVGFAFHRRRICPQLALEARELQKALSDYVLHLPTMPAQKIKFSQYSFCKMMPQRATNMHNAGCGEGLVKRWL